MPKTHCQKCADLKSELVNMRVLVDEVSSQLEDKEELIDDIRKELNKVNSSEKQALDIIYKIVAKITK